MNDIITKQIKMLEDYGFTYNEKKGYYERYSHADKKSRTYGKYYVRLHYDKNGAVYFTTCLFLPRINMALSTPTLERLYNFTSLIDDKLNAIEVEGRGYNE